MTRKIYWNSDALPESATIDQVLYDIRRSDAGAGLLLDSVSIADIIEDAEAVLTFDALVSPYAKLERKMEILGKIMERTGDKVKPVAMQITDPFKQRGVAQVAVVFELSDGQTVSIFFHNPDVTPNKMAPADEVISWKWLLNKKDITIVVAPERGADLNVREVARRIMRLAEKNSPAFQRVNGKRAERMQNIQTLKDEIGVLEKELATVQHELEVAKVAAEDDALLAGLGKISIPAVDVQNEAKTEDAIELTGKELGDFPDTEEGKKALRDAAKGRLETMVGTWVPCPALGGDVEIRKSGVKKFISTSADARKLRLVAVLDRIIGSGRKLASRPPYDGDSDKSARAYHTLRSEVSLAGDIIAVRTVVKEDTNGKFHYDMTVHAIEAVFDSAKDEGRDESQPSNMTTTNGGGTYPSRFARHQLDSIVGNNGQEFNPALDSVALDSATGSRMVLNLFIEGEEPEEVSDELTAAPDRQKEADTAQDANIGREWDSTWGRQRVVERKSRPTGDLYVVQTIGSEIIRQYSVGGMEDNIKRQEYELTPEYAAERAEKEETRKLKAERDERAQAEKERIDAEIAAFTDASGMAPPNAERARASLVKNVSRNGQITNLKSLIEEEVSDGCRVTGSGEDRRLSTEDGTFWTVKIISKTGMDYAEYLIAKRDAPLAANNAPLPEEPEVIAPASTESPAADQQMTADRALFQSVIDGTVADILAPELADSLEAAYYRQQTDPELSSLFEQAVDAYQAAMLAATADIK